MMRWADEDNAALNRGVVVRKTIDSRNGSGSGSGRWGGSNRHKGRDD